MTGRVACPVVTFPPPKRSPAPDALASATRQAAGGLRGAQTAAPAASGASPLTSLDTYPSYDHDVTLYRYPCGAVEMVDVPPRGANAVGVCAPAREPDEAEFLGRHRAKARRAATMVRRCALAADLRYMLTLTTRANILAFGESRHQLENFLRRLKRAHEGVRYVGAPEQQKRGAWHWHVLCDRYLEANPTRRLWRGVCGDGNIDLQHFQDPLQGALYAAKYIRKAFGQDRFLVGAGARYVRSRNIEVQSEKISAGKAFEVLAASGWSGETLPLDTGGVWAASWR